MRIAVKGRRTNTESKRSTESCYCAFLLLWVGVKMDDEVEGCWNCESSTDTHERSEDDECNLVPEETGHERRDAKTAKANVEDMFCRGESVK